MAKFTCMKVRVESFLIQLGNEVDEDKKYVELKDTPSGALLSISSFLNVGDEDATVPAVGTNSIYYLMYNGVDAQNPEAVQTAATANPTRIFLRKADPNENPRYFIKLMDSAEKASGLRFHCLTCKNDWVVFEEEGQALSATDMRECPDCHIFGFGCEFIGIQNWTGETVTGEPFPIDSPPNAITCVVKMP